jgi:hypothetical protein
MAELSTHQELALIQETETSVFLIQEGLLAYDRLSGANDFYHGPLALLAQGFERLMKVVICLGQLETEGTLPTPRRVKKYGHNLIALADVIVNLSEGTGYADSRSAARMDIDFMTSDERLRELLAVLTDFGEWGRYYNLDTLLNRTEHVAARDDPATSVQRIERRILDQHPEWISKMKGRGFDDAYSGVKAELTATLQRFARALCRMFTLGPLGDRGQRLLGVVKVFVFLKDEDLHTVPRRWFNA